MHVIIRVSAFTFRGGEVVSSTSVHFYLLVQHVSSVEIHNQIPKKNLWRRVAEATRETFKHAHKSKQKKTKKKRCRKIIAQTKQHEPRQHRGLILVLQNDM